MSRTFPGPCKVECTLLLLVRDFSSPFSNLNTLFLKFRQWHVSQGFSVPLVRTLLSLSESFLYLLYVFLAPFEILTFYIRTHPRYHFTSTVSFLSHLNFCLVIFNRWDLSLFLLSFGFHRTLDSGIVFHIVNTALSGFSSLSRTTPTCC